MVASVTARDGGSFTGTATFYNTGAGDPATAGEVLLALIEAASGATITGPAGFTPLLSGVMSSHGSGTRKYEVFGKVAAGGETSMSATTSTGRAWGHGWRLSGANATLVNLISAAGFASSSFADNSWPTVTGPTPAIAKNGSAALFLCTLTDALGTMTSVGTYAPPNEDEVVGAAIDGGASDGYSTGLSPGTVISYNVSAKPSSGSGFAERNLYVLVIRPANTAPGAPGAITSPADSSTHGTTTGDLLTLDGAAATDAEGDTLQYEWEISRNNGGSWSALAALGAVDRVVDISAIADTTAAKVRYRAHDGTDYGAYTTQTGTFTIAHDSPHAPPTLLSPTGGTTTDRTATALRWQANPAVGGSGQSKVDVRYRTTGAGVWTTVAPAVIGAGDTYLIPSTLAVDEWEWQAQTYNAMDEASGWSGSAIFNAGNIPSAPTITSHTLDEVIATASDLLEWTGTGTSTRARVVADDGAGNPDTGDILEDTGTVTPGVTSAGFTFDNNVTVHLQVMRTVSGLDSDWASVRVDVDYDDPAAPTVDVAEVETGALTVTITNPAPTGAQPALDYNEVHKRIKRVSPTGAVTYEKANGDQITATGYRVATDLAAAETFTDRAVPSFSAEQIERGESVEYLARAWGVNGTFVDGDWA